jgi:hypothetical protein
LNGLAQREIDGAKIILPIWHGVDVSTVRAFSPPLADRVAVRWVEGSLDAALELLDVIRPDLMEASRRDASRLQRLPAVTSGRELARIVAGPHLSQFFNDSPETEKEAQSIAAFLQNMQDWADIWNDLDVGEHVKAEFMFDEELHSLRAAGWSVYGKPGKKADPKGGATWRVALIAVLKGDTHEVFLDGDRIAVMRPPTAQS